MHHTSSFDRAVALEWVHYYKLSERFWKMNQNLLSIHIWEFKSAVICWNHRWQIVQHNRIHLRAFTFSVLTSAQTFHASRAFCTVSSYSAMVAWLKGRNILYKDEPVPSYHIYLYLARKICFRWLLCLFVSRTALPTQLCGKMERRSIDRRRID